MLAIIKSYNGAKETFLLGSVNLPFIQAKQILDDLVEAGEVVKENGIYYDQKNTDKK